MILALLATPVLVLMSMASQATSAPPGEPSHPRSLAQRSLLAVASANRSAVVEPSQSGFVNAAQIYPWTEGAVYRLFAAPGLVSDIALQQGETLNSVAAGDTSRWIVGDTSSGSGSSRRTHILVKPSSAGLRTNLIITTDRRVYLLLVQSTRGPAMAALSWTYPADELLAVKHAREAAPIAQGIDIAQLNFDYSISGDRPAWRPLRAFDDGAQVFIEFPPTIGTGEIPPLFVIGSSGRAELTNYRQQGRYYIVDRLFSIAELRMGEKHQQVVRIVRSRSSREGAGR